MFALPEPPPETLELRGLSYRRVKVFKHDFFAATCLYERANTTADAKLPKIVVKFCRTRPFWGIPGEWLGKLLIDHEQAIYRALDGVTGVPRWVARLSNSACAIEYREGRPLDHEPPPTTGFFEKLRALLDAVHARGVGHCDTNKRSNILITPDDEPVLLDYQLAVRTRDDLPWPLRAIARHIVRYIAQRDIYHLYKHKRRMKPDELTDDERKLSYRRSGLHWLHRKLTKPWRAVRRDFLHQQHKKGQLVSPTHKMEDHHQPEKATWRDRKP